MTYLTVPIRPQLVPVPSLRAGEVGYVATGLKNVREAQVGDTITSAAAPAPTPLPGYQEANSLVFAGIYDRPWQKLSETLDLGLMQFRISSISSESRAALWNDAGLGGADGLVLTLQRLAEEGASRATDVASPLQRRVRPPCFGRTHKFRPRRPCRRSDNPA